MVDQTILEQSNRLLREVNIDCKIPILLLLTGSSGCGKTYLCQELKAYIDSSRAVIHHFDSIGVPPHGQMIAEFGSGEAWQRAKTHEWIGRLIEIEDKVLVIFEGQYNPHFAIEALARFEVENWAMAVVTCEQVIWEQRLRGLRGQAFLITDAMRNWARVLREETERLGGSVIDTSASDLNANLKDVVRLINPLIEKRIKR